MIAAAANVPPPDSDKKVGLAASGVAVSNVASGFGVEVPKSKEDKDFVIWPEGDPATKKPNEIPKSKCENTSARTFDKPETKRLAVPRGCIGVRVRAWGAGGGSGASGGDGGGAAYVYTEGEIDPAKHDVIVVVGGPGGDGTASSPGLPGFANGGRGGASGGGGGGVGSHRRGARLGGAAQFCVAARRVGGDGGWFPDQGADCAGDTAGGLRRVALVAARRGADPKSSYVAGLLAKGEDAILRKYNTAYLFWRNRYMGVSTKVRNMKLHPNIDNNMRMQDVWLAS